MNKGKAIAIFKDIYNEAADVEEKITAIQGGNRYGNDKQHYKSGYARSIAVASGRVHIEEET